MLAMDIECITIELLLHMQNEVIEMERNTKKKLQRYTANICGVSALTQHFFSHLSTTAMHFVHLFEMIHAIPTAYAQNQLNSDKIQKFLNAL